MHDDSRVRPNGLAIRRLRHERGWSPDAMVEEIARTHHASTGLRCTITPNLLAGIEERNEVIPYETLCQVAASFDCDPVDLLAIEVPSDG